MVTIQQLKILLLALSVTLFSNSALAAHHVSSNCDDPENALFISLSSDDVWKASMALNYATRNLQYGPVTIFMNVEGTRIGVKEKKLPHDTYALNGKTTLVSLEAFLDAGGKGLVCPACLTRAGFKEKHLIEHHNLSMGQADLVRSELDCSYKQLSW